MCVTLLRSYEENHIYFLAIFNRFSWDISRLPILFSKFIKFSHVLEELKNSTLVDVPTVNHEYFMCKYIQKFYTNTKRKKLAVKARKMMEEENKNWRRRHTSAKRESARRVGTNIIYIQIDGWVNEKKLWILSAFWRSRHRRRRWKVRCEPIFASFSALSSSPLIALFIYLHIQLQYHLSSSPSRLLTFLQTLLLLRALHTLHNTTNENHQRTSST